MKNRLKDRPIGLKKLFVGHKPRDKKLFALELLCLQFIHFILLIEELRSENE